VEKNLEVWSVTDRGKRRHEAIWETSAPSWESFTLGFITEWFGPATLEDINEGAGFRVEPRLLLRKLKELERKGYIESELVPAGEHKTTSLKKVSAFGGPAKELELRRDSINPTEYNWLRNREGSPIPEGLADTFWPEPGEWDGIEMVFPGVQKLTDMPEHWGMESSEYPIYKN